MIARSFFKKVRKMWQESQLNRDLIGTDMYGNKYYQFYDEDELPLKREVEYKDGIHEPLMDPIWANWLNGSETLPPSQKEIEESYQGYLDRAKVGSDWDVKDEEMMKVFRETMKKVNPQKKKPSSEFTPDSWQGDVQKKKKY